MCHARGGLLVFVLTRSAEAELVALIRLPLLGLGVAIERSRMLSYFSCASGGVSIVYLAYLATTTLVDSDIVSAGNRVRHDLDIDALGIEKVQAMGQRLVRVNPSVEFVGFSDRFGETPQTRDDAIYAALAKADLIVNATAHTACAAVLHASIACIEAACGARCGILASRSAGGLPAILGRKS